MSSEINGVVFPLGASKPLHEKPGSLVTAESYLGNELLQTTPGSDQRFWCAEIDLLKGLSCNNKNTSAKLPGVQAVPAATKPHYIP